MSDIKQEEILNYIANHASGNSDYGYGGTVPNRIAKKVMVELVKAGYADFILLRDDEVNKWWTKLLDKAVEEIQVYKEKMRMYEIKLSGYEKLSEEDRKILGIRKPIKPKPLNI